MRIQTPVEIGKFKQQINYSDKILLAGSCFSDEIGSVLRDYRFNIMTNPFGTLYNPASICISLLRLGAAAGLCKMPLDISPFFTEKDIVNRPDGLYVTFFHHSSCGDRDAKMFLQKANEKLKNDAEFFKASTTVIITLGTSWVFRYIGIADKQIVAGKENPAAGGTGMIVSNCHKLPAKYFSREFLPVSQTANLLHTIINSFPDKHFIFTVSPIRHKADGAHGNQISKSSLLLAVESIISESRKSANEGIYCRDKKRNAEYFPAYEIMMDELRDYRWYEEDMIHPSHAAVKYIFEKFRDACISAECYEQMEEELKKTKRENHHPFGGAE